MYSCCHTDHTLHGNIDTQNQFSATLQINFNTLADCLSTDRNKTEKHLGRVQTQRVLPCYRTKKALVYHKQNKTETEVCFSSECTNQNDPITTMHSCKIKQISFLQCDTSRKL